MRTRSTIFVLLAVLAATATAAPSAGAASPAQKVLADCNTHNTLTRSYPATALKQALAIMPVDQKEYSDCADVIEHTLLGNLNGKGSGSGGSGGSFLPTWLIVVLVLLLLGGATLAAMEIRRRRGVGGGGAPPDGGGGETQGSRQN